MVVCIFTLHEANMHWWSMMSHFCPGFGSILYTPDSIFRIVIKYDNAIDALTAIKKQSAGSYFWIFR